MNESTETPDALMVWDNRARLSLPKPLLLWLLCLVVTFLCSLAFVRVHTAPRWVIGGFIASHLIVIWLSNRKGYVLRRGMVSLTHVLGWSPALAATVVELVRGHATGSYLIWLIAQTAVITISFLFDVRDSVVFLRGRTAQ